jgi:outer membrane lipoprotein-sorting protein
MQFCLSAYAQGNNEVKKMIKILEKKASLINSYVAEIEVNRITKAGKIKQVGNVFYLKNKAILYDFSNVYVNEQNRGMVKWLSDGEKVTGIKSFTKQGSIIDLKKLYEEFGEKTKNIIEPMVYLNIARPFEFRRLKKEDIENFNVELLNNKLTYTFDVVFVNRLSKKKTKAEGKLWIDPDTGILLKAESYSKEKPVYTMEVKKIKTNIPINSDKFKIEIPADYKIIDLTPRWEKILRNNFKEKNKVM